MRTGESRIAGLRLGEVEINMISGPTVVVNAKFALLREDGSPCGSVSKSREWSDATEDALRKFAEALEADVFADVFKGTPGPPESEEEAVAATEVKQF